ncbi:MBL fold metallo-hydrolase [Ideonella livida]|uniref:MBL fold metallo-hydrolase n=1 Tax=Ideonella livida TaxID=2707176 RepID=A0A7C9PGE9_9BURK|nr:MBL fold metallo-hydrolase [Ideonella livida]NDY91253.1 MBL fold metallo-hydrolase [Ideonella livida]
MSPFRRPASTAPASTTSDPSPRPARRLWRALPWLALPGLALATAQLYANSDGGRIDKSLWEVLHWNVSRPSDAGQPAQALPLVHEARGRAPAAPGELSVTWIGHATALLRVDGLTVLTDPMFSERAGPLSWLGSKRYTPAAYGLHELPRIDLVLLSHNHYDHLDLPSLRALQAQAGGPPRIMAPPGLQAWLEAEGLGPVQTTAWWQSTTAEGATVTALPARHWSGRGLTDRHQSHWTGWLLARGGRQVFFAGDTGYSPDFQAIGQRHPGIDLALLPVGAYLPRDFMKDQHVDPEEAVRIHRELGARHSLGIHWGTFALADDGPERNQADLAAALTTQNVSPQDFRLLAHGATWTLHPPAPR